MTADSNQPEPREWGWTFSQRRALLAILSILLVVLCIRLAFNPQYVSNPQPPQGSRAGELASRIDPNTADWQTLAAVPGLGEKRAKSIVEYRDRLRASDANVVVFRDPSDLRHIRGIGVATIQNLRPYLLFPSDRATTQP